MLVNQKLLFAVPTKWSHEKVDEPYVSEVSDADDTDGVDADLVMCGPMKKFKIEFRQGLSGGRKAAIEVEAESLQHAHEIANNMNIIRVREI